MYRRWIKRLADLTAAVLGLVCTAPLLLAAAGALAVANRGAGIFFVQERPGLRGRIFRIVKFRTMTDARDASGRLLPDAQRITPLGRLLRATSIDELPQLWNVLRGDMSLVGPRPLLPEYLSRYSARLDLQILLLTVCKVLRREGIGSADGATKEPFEGTETNMQNKEIR